MNARTIAFVCDDLSGHGNGTSVTAYRYAEALRKLGCEVRLVGVGAMGEGAHPVPEKQLPVVTPISHSCGFRFGEPVQAIFDEAFDGVDLIHLFLPFELERAALAWARMHEVPVSAAFHLQPENITYNARIGSAPAVASALYAGFRHGLYDRVRHVHCPSTMIAGELKRHGYRAHTHVISNGVPELFQARPEATPLIDAAGRIHILSVGRLGKEKDQATIIKAIAHSRFKDQITLHLAGKGYLEKKLMNLADRLGVSLTIGYYDEQSLAEVMRCCPLTVHASVADIEAISVLESFASGSVAIIARSPKSAPARYAVDPHCLFAARDVEGLARCLDWWVEHPEELAPARELYLLEAESLRLERCAESFLAMAEQAVADDELAYRLHGTEVVVRGASSVILAPNVAPVGGVPAVAAAVSRGGR